MTEYNNSTIENKNDAFWEVFTNCLPKYFQILRKESERGSSIIIVTLMDEALQKLLRSRLAPSPEKKDELFDGPYSPLSTFSAKIDFAYRVGTIGLGLKSSLHLIRRVRNDFAHSSNDITFESLSVHDRIQEIFNLNKDLLDAIWEIINKNPEPEIQKIIGEYKSTHGVDYLVKVAGWRSTFEFLSSTLAALLEALRKDIEQIRPKHEK